MFKILSTIIFFSIFLHANIITLDSNIGGINTFSQISFHEDTSKKMGIEDIKVQEFKSTHTIHANQGVSNSTWWLKLDVQNPKNETINWILKFNYGQFDEIQSWQYNDKNILISNSLKGDHYIDESKISLSERTSFEFTTLAKEKNTIYIKASYINGGIIELFHTIWTKNEFLKSQELRFNIIVGVLSSLMVLLFYNTFICFILRKREYFWYCTYIIGVILSVLTFNQLGAHYLWSNSLYLVDMMPFIAVVILISSFILFTREFLETYKYLPKIDKILKVLLLVNVMILLLANFDARHFAIVLIFIITFSFIFFPFIGFVLWRRGYKIARGYTIATLVLSISIIISLLRFSDVLESSEMIFWIARFGFIAEGILLSIALADRISLLEQDAENSQKKVRQTLEEAKENLESKVKKRTLELEEQTKKAEELARTDVMTGIANRRAFFEKGQDLIQHNLRYKTPFSLVIIDVDHFKNINDTYGHEVGDFVLIELTKEISNSIRDTDFFARIGGEEFTILLSHTTSELAMQITKKLLENINKLEINYKDS
ncbi:MAG: diguanylate cyclase (GGDEF)-like protein, partial [Sulfurimonas sp.]